MQAPSWWVLLVATVALVLRNARLPAPYVLVSYAGAGDPSLASTSADEDDDNDPLSFLYPEVTSKPPLGLRFDARPGRVPRLIISSPEFVLQDDGPRYVQVDSGQPIQVDAGTKPRGERITVELQGLPPGPHAARAWCQGTRGEVSRETSIEFLAGADVASERSSTGPPSSASAERATRRRTTSQ